MERVKIILVASSIICLTVFTSTFFYLDKPEVDEVYHHMQTQFSDVMSAVGLSNTTILSKDEWIQPNMNDLIKERVQALLSSVDTDALYSYDEDAVDEIVAQINSIYTKEIQRFNLENANQSILLIRIVSGIGLLLVVAIHWILRKKKAISKPLNDKNVEKLEKIVESTNSADQEVIAKVSEPVKQEESKEEEKTETKETKPKEAKVEKETEIAKEEKVEKESE